MAKASLRARAAAGFAAARARSAGGPAAAPDAAAKAGGITLEGDAGWRSPGGSRFGQFYAGSDVDWEKKAGVLWENPAVAICLNFVLKKMAEPRLEVATEAGDGSEEKATRAHPLLDLLETPNGEYDGTALLQATAITFLLTGEGFWYRGRGMNGAGATREFWFIPPWEIEPVTPPGGRGPTQMYKRTVGGTVEWYTRDEIVHFKFGMDPRNPRRGWSPFRAMFREVVSDSEIASYTATVLRNLGVLGYMVSPKDSDDTFEAGQDVELKRLLRAAITGDNRADVVVSDIPLDVDRVGYSPQELAITDMGDRPEARIAAALGLNTMAVALPAGRASMKYANLKEARAAAWEDCIIPMLTLFARTLWAACKGEFGAPGEALRWCYDLVRDLLPDLAAEHDRARKNFASGVWKLSEARRATGVAVADGDPDGHVWDLDRRRQGREGAAEGGDPPPSPPTDDGEKEP